MSDLSSTSWRPYLIGAVIHAVSGVVGYINLIGFAMAAADSGMLDAPFWLKAFAVVVIGLMLPLAFPLIELGYRYWPGTSIDSAVPLFVLACLLNSLVLAWLARQVHLWIKHRKSARASE